MGTATGLTADRMLAIEAESIIDGLVDGSGHLILTRHDGATIDAGNVQGPQGPPYVNGVDTINNQTINGVKSFTNEVVIGGGLPNGGGYRLSIYQTVGLGSQAPLFVKSLAGAAGDGNYQIYLGHAGDPILGWLIGHEGASSGKLKFAVESGSGPQDEMTLSTGGILAIAGTDHYFGPYALPGGVGSRAHISVNATGTFFMAEGDTANRDLVLRSKGSGKIYAQDETGATRVQIDASGGITAKGQNNYFGIGAFGAAGTYVNIGDLGDPTGVYMVASGTPANISVIIRQKGSGNVDFQDGGGSLLGRFVGPQSALTNTITTLQLVYHNGTSIVSQRVTVGGANSGGAGFRTLLVPN